MRLFEFKDYVLTVREELWGLSPFKKILKRDKSRTKETALKEVLFVYYFCDIKSDYMIMSDLEVRTNEIKKDIELPVDWKLDETMNEAITFYESRTLTIIGKLCMNAMKAGNDISEYLSHTDTLLAERDDRGKPVHTLTGIVGGLAKIKTIIADLNTAEKEIIREQFDTENKMKGSKTMGMFEDGI